VSGAGCACATCWCTCLRVGLVGRPPMQVAALVGRLAEHEVVGRLRLRLSTLDAFNPAKCDRDCDAGFH
jgi:hypothetical protein